MSATAIKVKNLTKTYGEGTGRFTALRGVSVTAELGESLAIVGKSGSGKSTCLRLMLPRKAVQRACPGLVAAAAASVDPGSGFRS